MQPVVELRTAGTAFAYGVRAPRAGGVVPPTSYRSDRFCTLDACLLDVGRGLARDFPRVYVRLDSVCVGEQDTADLLHSPSLVARRLEAAWRYATAPADGPRQSAMAE